MICELKVLSEQYSHKSRLVACCRKIASFAEAFAPYFEVINIFVQIKPDWIGWFWGSIRLIFQVDTSEITAISLGRRQDADTYFKLGSNLIVFLENVAMMFENIAFTLPQYQAWFNLCQRNVTAQDKDRLGQALSFVYADMIEFCLHTYRIFSRAKLGKLCPSSAGRYYPNA